MPTELGEGMPLQSSSVRVPPMNEVTRVLSAIEQGDPHAAEQLLPLVYDELRKLAAQKLAQEKPGQTLQATALVHEAYLRLVDTGRRSTGIAGATSLPPQPRPCAVSSSNHARDKRRQKRGGGRQRVDLDRLAVVDQASADEVLALDEALQRLEHQNQPCAELVKLRFFAGLTMEEAAAGAGHRPADGSSLLGIRPGLALRCLTAGLMRRVTRF